MDAEYKTRTRSLIDDVVQASKVPAKRRVVDVKPKVAELASVAYSQGLLPDELLDLIDLVVSPSHLDQASLNSIIKNLYPTGKVSEDVIIRTVGCLGLGEIRPSLTLQSALLNWVIQVYHVLDLKAQAVLSRAYGVLFNLLDVSATRPQLFHILAIITRRKHVQHYRIQALLNLSRQAGNDRHLQGLLRVFRNYYPEIIVGNTAKGTPFKVPDPEWRDRLSVIQKMHRDLEQSNLQGPKDGFKINQQLLTGSKGNGLGGLPPVQTSNSHEKSVTLEEIDSAESLAANLDKIELPDHLVAVLVDPLLQKFMILRPDLNLRRASAWMDVQLAEILNGDADDRTVGDTLRVILEYARATKDISPFFAGIIKMIGLRLHLKADVRVHDLLAYAPLMGPEDFSFMASTLQTAILDGSAASQLDLLALYTNMLRHWNVILLASEASIPKHASESIDRLISHANQLALTALQTSPTAHTALSVLDFYERAAHVYSNGTLLRSLQITIPPVPLVYTLQFTTSLAVESRLCSVLAAYKQAFATYMANAAKALGPQYDKAQVNTFNGFLMDICNCLWRGKAFATRDAHARGCMLSASPASALTAHVAGLSSGSGAGDMALLTLFTMSYSPLLCMQAADHLRRLEEKEDEDVVLRVRHAGPVTAKSLGQLARRGGLELTWQDYRLGVLRHLEAEGFGGISELMYSTMRNLLDAKAKG
ncbi:hypothetical protein KVR01_006572 [Diaporthe batatas]|uniref:uncharacterized protein n=1 Tax=Diaporthe batatas TaxID=748121 RepID=UPI001D04B0AE|nr:uncharacterized protein KVR01_006572 [Diaporthe batatas]KAG8163275.1 hypothetical protein KVR01_006572 [Diaporthe batatas]